MIRAKVGVLILAVTVGGCGKRTGTVEGTVKLGEEKLGSGTVTFFGSGGSIKTSPISAQGTYKIEGIPTGPAIITVETTPHPDTFGRNPNLPPPPKDMPESKDEKSRLPTFGKYVEIPLKYKDQEKSGLTYTVQAGPQPFDIVLKP
jgi:hypothetical protein